MSIKFNETFSFYRDEFQWVLEETIPGLTEEGNARRPKKTDHSNLEQVHTAMLDRSLGRAKDLEEMTNILKKTRDEIRASLAINEANNKREKK